MSSQDDGITATWLLWLLWQICQNDGRHLHVKYPIPTHCAAVGAAGEGVHVHGLGTRLPVITGWQSAAQSPIPIKCCFVIQSPNVMGLQFVIRSPITIR
jgi:hypothetical protein